jgi:hypothetical protein
MISVLQDRNTWRPRGFISVKFVSLRLFYILYKKNVAVLSVRLFIHIFHIQNTQRVLMGIDIRVGAYTESYHILCYFLSVR